MIINNYQAFKLKQELNKDGNRLTRQRFLILKYLRGNKNHPTAEQVHKHIKKSLPEISLATIYRNLQYLLKQKQIFTIKTFDDKTHFDGENIFHMHFICENCHTIKNIYNIDEYSFKQVKKFGMAGKTTLNLYGFCNKCQS